MNNSSEGLLISAPFWETDMVGYIVPFIEPTTAPLTNMEAAFGRLHSNEAGAVGARPILVG